MIWVPSRFFSMNVHECIRNEIQYTQNTISREMISTTHFRKTNTFFISQKKFVMLILKIIMKELVNAYTGVDLAIYFCQPSFDPMIRPTQSNTSILYPSTVNTNVPIKSQNNFWWVSIEDFVSIDLLLWSWPNWNEFRKSRKSN